jgi:hypothetical protein
MLPRLQAQDALRLSTIVSVGNGVLKKHEGDRIRREWLKQAREKTTRQKLSKNQAEIMMMQLGIGVIHKKDKTGDG